MSENFHNNLCWLLSLAGLACGVGAFFFTNAYDAAGFFALFLAALPPVYNRARAAFGLKTPQHRYLFIFIVYIVLGLPGSYLRDQAAAKEEARVQEVIKARQREAEQNKAALMAKAREKAKKEAAQKKLQKQIARAKAREERKKAAGRDRQKALAGMVRFRAAVNKTLRKAGVHIVEKMYNDPDLPRVACMVMSPVWHNRNKHLRKNDAKVFQQLWTAAFSPGDPDGAPIRLLSINGDIVGGSRWLGASRVWVED